MRRSNFAGLAGIAIVMATTTGCGRLEGPGEISGKAVPAKVVAERATAQNAAVQKLTPDAEARPEKQILFGDLHVHTTFSADAFLMSLPILYGEGAHPPADACDFARFCSGLDFWSINDHSEAISPKHWRETKESIRQCNAINTDARNPDVVAFLGWEWTQVGQTPEDHYGHKNVILRETADDRVPTRPISALSPRLVGALRQPPPLRQRIMMPLLDFAHRQRYWDFGAFVEELADTPICPSGVDVRELPDSCTEVALSPDLLFEKLNQWGYDSMVIPHGTTWGLYTPPGTTLDKQLAGKMHDPARQTLFEIYSGHGNSEEYRDWRAIEWGADGDPICPAPTKNYEPCCWRAGEIIRKRCLDANGGDCDRRAQQAQVNFLRAGVMGRMTVPGTEVSDWLNCGQCADCFNPAYNYRPGNSGQYALAISNFDDPANPRRFRFGFIASSDNHSARPGTGYKEYDRQDMTEAAGARDASWRERLAPPQAPTFEEVGFDPNNPGVPAFVALDFERQASFFMTGGLVAVHSAGRDRDAIWDAMQRKEVFGTSGERILLWFDLLNGPAGEAPMGSEVAIEGAPRFRVRAVGSFKQKPGCPEHSVAALDQERLEALCRGECYNPSDERHRITRIEVVRIRPQQSKDEPVAGLIEDPWKRFECGPDPAGCAVEFEDPDFTGEREYIYYARAIQEPTPAVNAGGLRCTYDDKGECVSVNPCYGDYRTAPTDDCLSPNEERAWSSPLFVTRAGA